MSKSERLSYEHSIISIQPDDLKKCLLTIVDAVSAFIVER
jgi:hypothetical protein